MRVKGHSGHLIVPIVAIPAITLGALTYYRDHLPEFCIENAGKVVALSALLTLALVAVALFRRARSVEMRGDELRYRSWIGNRTVRLADISAVTFETEISGSSDQATTEHYLSLWSGHDLLLRFNTSLWPRDGLRALLRELKGKAPSVRLDRDVDEYVNAS